jgi:hypothetical protein
MKNTFRQQVLPHLVSMAIFLIVAVVFCKPALESDVVMKQSDITNWEGGSHQSFVYKEKHGRFPLWSTSMYSGMPAYQIAMEGPWTPLGIIDTILKLGLPKPMSFFFLASLCFYFLCLCLRVRPWVAVIGGLAFAYGSTFPQFITAGHDTQIFALAYAPAVLGGIILLFHKKYIPGFICTALFTGLQIAQGHQQISYYLFLVAGIMSICLLIYAWRNNQLAQQTKALGLIMAACIVGVAINAVSLLTVYDYSKHSKRNGQLVMDQQQNSKEVVSNNKTKGLSKEYAFQWSYGWTESLSLLFPGVMGYGAHGAVRDNDQFLFPRLDENSHVGKYFTEKLNMPEEQATNLALNQSSSLYWGDQPNTTGPIYLGAVVCLLFMLAMVYLEGPHKWWLLTAAVLGVLLALGKHFAAFNYFVFDHLPLYNKFRVPTLALEITEIVLPVGMVLALEKLVSSAVIDLKKMKQAALVTATIFAAATILYFTLDYSSENKQRTAAINQVISHRNNATIVASMDSINRRFEPLPDNNAYEELIFQYGADATIARNTLAALRQDRQQAYGASIVRSLLFVVLAMALVFAFIKKKINATLMLAGLGVVIVIDQVSFGSNYLNRYNFGSKEQYEANEFPLSPADKEILKDPDPNFRVLNGTVGDPFISDSRTSYYHKSIGGYHPARLGIYDDLISYQLSASPNPAVLNMLNTKYFIETDQQTKTTMAVRNPGALGNCWFVQHVQYVHGPVAEMKALYNFNPAETAIVDDTFKNVIGDYSMSADSTATIKQVAFDNENIKYESNSTGNRLALFSEMYYTDWKAYIDGRPAPYAKANYVLRAMLLPAGKHSIEFKFEPTVYYIGRTITAISAWVLTVLLLGYGGWVVGGMLQKNKAGIL